MGDVIQFKQKPKFTHLADVPPGEDVVDLCTCDGSLFVATTGGIYKLVGNKLVRLEFELDAHD